jgi:flavin reductase (DIM6/NTAB) family NADH-FMN oxidoreductase RutF
MSAGLFDVVAVTVNSEAEASASFTVNASGPIGVSPPLVWSSIGEIEGGLFGG